MRGVSAVGGGSNPNYNTSSSRANGNGGRGCEQRVGGSNSGTSLPVNNRGGGSNYNYPQEPSRGYSTTTSTNAGFGLPVNDRLGGHNNNYPQVPARGYSTNNRDSSPDQRWYGSNWFPVYNRHFSWTPFNWLPRGNRHCDHRSANGHQRPIRGRCSSLCAGLAVSAVGVLVRSVQLVAFGVMLGVVLAFNGGCGPDRDFE